MSRVARGDAQACRLLVDRHLGPITAFGFRMLGDRQEAEDVAQETFLRLWRHASGWEPRAKVTTWLHRVAHNLCVDRLRARREIPVKRLPDHADSKEAAPAQIERRQMSQAVTEALAQLPERQQAAITLVYYQGLSNLEAAEVLGVHVDGVESLLVRGRRNLRKRLGGDDNAPRKDKARNGAVDSGRTSDE